MTKILIAIAALMVAAVATAAPASADCIRLTDDPASPCRAIQGITEPPVVEYSVTLGDDVCVARVEYTNPPEWAREYDLRILRSKRDVYDSTGIVKSHKPYAFHKSLIEGPLEVVYPLSGAYGVAASEKASLYHSRNTRGLQTRYLGVDNSRPGDTQQWYIHASSHSETWRRQEYSYSYFELFPFDGWTYETFRTALFDCAQELEDKLDREDEAARVAAEQRAIAVEERERELELSRRLLIQVNDLKLAQERLASEVKLQEKETRITAEIVALQKRLIETRIATQEAILSGLERRAEIIRTGALERNEIMQEFLLQSGSRYEDIESKQAETAAVLRELRAGFAETQRRNEQALAAQEALLLEAEQQEAEISAELADKEAELEADGADE